MFARGLQSLSLYKLNNVGERVKGIDLQEIFADQMHEEGGLVRNVSIDVPTLSEQRTRLNDSHMLSSNWLFKTRRDDEVRFNVSGIFDKQRLSQSTVTEYTDIVDSNRLEESIATKSYKNKVAGELSYKVNRDNLYLDNEATVAWSFDHSSGQSIVGGTPQTQYVRPHKLKLIDELRVVNKLRNGRRLNTSAYVAYNYLPSTLLTIKEEKQRLNLSSTFAGASTNYSQPLSGINLHLSVSDDIASQHVNLVSSAADYRYTMNKAMAAVTLSDKTTYATWRIHLPLFLYSQWLDEKSSTRLVLAPTLSLGYKPNAHWEFTSSYSFSNTPVRGTNISTLPIFRSYRTIRIGTGEFDSRKSHNLSFNSAYKHTRHGLFASLDLDYSSHPDETLYASSLEENIFRSVATHFRGDTHAFGGIGKVAKNFGSKFTVRLTARFDYSTYRYLISETVVPASYHRTLLSIGLSYKPLPILTLEESSIMSLSKQHRNVTNAASAFSQRTRNFNHEFNVFFTPKKWVVKWANELYHSSDESASFNFFSDLSVSRIVKGGEVSLSFNNLFGNSTYERRIVSTRAITYSQTRLRPREILVKYAIAL